MTRRAAGLFLAAVLPLSGCMGHAYRTKPHVAVVDGDPIVQMSGPLPSLNHPRQVPFRQHTDPPFRDEKVLGVRLSDPRMYPIGLLDTYEVINDDAAGVPYVVVRCALTGFAGVLDRRVAGRTLTFENSGAIWRDMLVLRDLETHTYWAPVSGIALSGALAGERLRRLPSALTTADGWEELLPETSCLETGDLSAVPLRVKMYANSSWQGVSGVRSRDLRFPPKETVFLVSEGSEAIAFSSAQIRKVQSVPLSLGTRRVVVEWDAGLRCPRAYGIESPERRQEIAVISLYWFAATRHFPGVKTLSQVSASS